MTDAKKQATCAAPGCSKPVKPKATGRPPKYCSERCQSRASSRRSRNAQKPGKRYSREIQGAEHGIAVLEDFLANGRVGPNGPTYWIETADQLLDERRRWEQQLADVRARLERLRELAKGPPKQAVTEPRPERRKLDPPDPLKLLCDAFVDGEYCCRPMLEYEVRYGTPGVHRCELHMTRFADPSGTENTSVDRPERPPEPGLFAPDPKPAKPALSPEGQAWLEEQQRKTREAG